MVQGVPLRFGGAPPLWLGGGSDFVAEGSRFKVSTAERKWNTLNDIHLEMATPRPDSGLDCLTVSQIAQNDRVWLCDVAASLFPSRRCPPLPRDEGGFLRTMQLSFGAFRCENPFGARYVGSRGCVFAVAAGFEPSLLGNRVQIPHVLYYY